MKILFVWTGVTSYMADCWRALQRRPGVDLRVLVEDVESGKEFDASAVLHGLTRFSDREGWTPDVLFAVGWHSTVVKSFLKRADWRDIPKVCCFDMPWRWALRCLAARWVLAPILSRYCSAYVPGEACARYARWLGFKHIDKGLFSIDVRRFAGVPKPPSRRGFVYVGRRSPEKRLDLVRKAHQRYRELGGEWDVDFVGGDNFVSPDEMPRLYASHACLLLASAFDPWPLVALEARASGCEVIMSDRCGNRLELDAHAVKFGDVEEMARAMLAVEKTPSVGAAPELAFWDCESWADRTLALAEGVS